MTLQEASYIIKKNEDEYIDRWNQTRYIAYAIIQSQSTKALTPTDIIEFPWEREFKPVKSKEEIESERQKLIQYALDQEKKLNSNGR